MSDSGSSNPSSSGDVQPVVMASSLFLSSFVALASMFAVSFFVTASYFIFTVIGLPLSYLYLVQTCPPNSSFNAKVQLKRVMTGADLPDGDPNKPRGLIQKMGRNITSNLAALAFTAGGYQEDFYSILGAATVVKVTIPSANLVCYWIGCGGPTAWYYWGSMDLDASTKAD